MKKLQDLDAKVCLTASGCLIHEDKVLLIKHKKVGSWLCPGGHIDPNELPHQSAQREFWEETGIKVSAEDPFMPVATDGSEYVPNPVLSNLHWVCKDNYQIRTQGKKTTKKSKVWKKGCEQHFNLFYLVKPTGSLNFKKNVEETDGIGWFSLAEIDKLDLFGNVRMEIKRARAVIKHQ
jgi:8-oxo-dGTP diphosphatase